MLYQVLGKFGEGQVGTFFKIRTFGTEWPINLEILAKLIHLIFT